MALEAVVYPQDHFHYAYKDYYSLGLGAGAWGYDFYFQEEDKPHLLGNLHNNNRSEQSNFHASWDNSSSPSMMQHAKAWVGPNSSPEACTGDQSPPGGLFTSMKPPAETAKTTGGRRKRRRVRSSKNKEEIENQRMTHIAVERNRRKQMNEYLAVLRSLMPNSYVQRGDQASIIGSSINFVKELEQLLQSMEGHKRATQQAGDNGVSSPFADFFTFPRYASRATQCNNNSSSMANDSNANESVADIEVTMVESHANVRILTKRRPRQLMKLVDRFQNLQLSILHLNVTSTVDQMVLYSVSVKVEEGRHLNTVDEISAAVNQVLATIQEEDAFN